MKKYVRIQVRYTGKTGKPVGIFGACHHVVHSSYHPFNATDDDRKLFKEIEDWFELHLPNPPFYAEGNPEKYITWFKTEKAGMMIEKLTPLMKLLEKYAVPYDIVYTDSAGTIVYEDEFQIAVK
ncbi:MAG: hypothetical protein HZC28_18600 [Spirochaetes bacterium]|nr:hypothetical protein [Spirochaetota bacterium]